MATIHKGDDSLSALLSLLDEPDDRVYEHIRSRILNFGSGIIPELEKFWDISYNDVIQNRLENIIHQLHLENIFHELNTWRHFEFNDLMKAWILVTRFHYNNLGVQETENKLEKIRRDIWLELSPYLTALEKIRVFNHIIYEVHGFYSGLSGTDDPGLYLLNELLETGKGNHISIGLLYMILAAGLNLPVYGVDLPDNFILAWMDNGEEPYTGKQEVLFYINPLSKGAVFTKREIEAYLRHSKIEPDPRFFSPADNIRVIWRLVSSLKASYKKAGETQRFGEITTLLKVLD